MTPHGVVAVGDSLVQGFGLPLAGVTCLSWPARLAEATDSCLTSLTMNGADAEAVLRDQAPRLAPGYAIGALMVGANDLANFRGERFTATVEGLVAALRPCCSVLLVGTLPLTLRNGAQSWRETVSVIPRVNAVLRETAVAAGALVVDLENALVAPWRMAPDHQHPTALGHLEIARRAAELLAGAGARSGSGAGTARPLREILDPAGLTPSPAEQRLFRVSAVARARGRAGTVRALVRSAVGGSRGGR